MSWGSSQGNWKLLAASQEQWGLTDDELDVSMGAETS
jgi:hypothetical protein